MPRILIVGPAWVGDTVLAQPFFMRLRQRIPQLELDVLAPPWTAAVLKRMPEVSAVTGLLAARVVRRRRAN